MWDALGFAVRDAIRSAGYGYSEATCEIMDDGRPPPRCGSIFIAVHESEPRSTNDNCLMEYFSFHLTLTMKVNVPLDRVGNVLLASKLARRPAPGGQPSFNARAELLRAFLHMNWGVLGVANNNLVSMLLTAEEVYGFAEPARYRGREKAVLVGGEWFTGDPEAQDVGLKSELRFEDCRRMQPIGGFV